MLTQSMEQFKMLFPVLRQIFLLTYIVLKRFIRHLYIKYRLESRIYPSAQCSLVAIGLSTSKGTTTKESLLTFNFTFCIKIFHVPIKKKKKITIQPYLGAHVGFFYKKKPGKVCGLLARVTPKLASLHPAPHTAQTLLYLYENQRTQILPS